MNRKQLVASIATHQARALAAFTRLGYLEFEADEELNRSKAEALRQQNEDLKKQLAEAVKDSAEDRHLVAGWKQRCRAFHSKWSSAYHEAKDLREELDAMSRVQSNAEKNFFIRHQHLVQQAEDNHERRAEAVMENERLTYELEQEKNSKTEAVDALRVQLEWNRVAVGKCSRLEKENENLKNRLQYAVEEYKAFPELTDAIIAEYGKGYDATKANIVVAGFNPKQMGFSDDEEEGSNTEAEAVPAP